MLNVAAWSPEAPAPYAWDRAEIRRERVLRLPDGFRCWASSPPAPDAPVLVLLEDPAGVRVERTTRAALADASGATPIAWQRQAHGKVLAPGWRLYPDDLPPPGAICCAMFFDLERELEDSAGFGRFERGGTLGRFVDRVAYPGEHDPMDPRRWAVFAWRETRDFERSHALLAASLCAGAMRPA